MKIDFKSASEQSGLKAGDGGFIVDVKQNTTLIGGVSVSSDKAVAGRVMDVIAPDGRGIRYDSNGKFIGLLEPSKP